MNPKCKSFSESRVSQYHKMSSPLLELTAFTTGIAIFIVAGQKDVYQDDTDDGVLSDDAICRDVV